MASRSASGGGVRFSALFPNLPNELDNCVDFIKRLTYHSFIQIMGSRRLSSIPVVKRVVKDKGWRLYTVKKDEFVGQRVHAKLVGAMDAIQRMHMKELILVISNNEEDADDALEVFTMQYIYGDEPHVSLVGDDGRRLVEKIKFRGSQYVEEDTYTVLAQIYKLCQVMERLPRNAYCSFRCTFYEGVPEDYVPPGWYDSKTLYKFDHEDALDFFSIADMHTPHLASFLSVKSAVILDEVEMREAIENGPSHMIDQTLNNSVDSLEGVPSSKMFHYADSPTTGRTVVVPSGSTPTHRSPDNAGHANQEQAPLLQNLQSENNDRDKPSEGTIVERKSATKLRAGGRKRVENKLVAENQQSSSSDDVSVGRHGRRGAPVQQPLEPVIKKSRTYRIDKITPPTTVLTSPRR